MANFFEDLLKTGSEHLNGLNSKITNGLKDWADPVAISKGVTKLESNKPINPIDGSKRWLDRGLTGFYRGVSNGAVDSAGQDIKMNMGEALKNAYTKADGNIDLGAIAGSYLGVSAGYRVLSGGGAYRDKNGNANLIGIPFV